MCFLVAMLSLGFVPPVETEKDNEYYRIVKLRREAFQKDSLVGLKKKAGVVGQRLLSWYESAQSISFVLKDTYYWFQHDSVASRQPMVSWRHRPRYELHYAGAGEKMLTTIFVKGQPLFCFCRSPGKLFEFKYPWNGLSGEQAILARELNYVHLRRGVEYDLLCDMGRYLQSWVGEQAIVPRRFLTLITDRGFWVGEMWLETGGNKVLVDVLVIDEVLPSETDWKALLIDKQGRLLDRLDIQSFSGSANENRFITRSQYCDIRRNEVKPPALELPATFLQESRSWRRYSESEAIAERQVAIKGQ